MVRNRDVIVVFAALILSIAFAAMGWDFFGPLPK